MKLLMTTLLKYDIYLSVLNNHQIRHTVIIFLTDLLYINYRLQFILMLGSNVLNTRVFKTAFKNALYVRSKRMRSYIENGVENVISNVVETS
jgi:hypothetical protein